VTIPAAGRFLGGTYNILSGCTFEPDTGDMSGSFQDADPDDPDPARLDRVVYNPDRRRLHA
jgi:hypothetical protein